MEVAAAAIVEGRDYAPTEIKIPMYVTAIILMAGAVIVYNVRYVFGRIPPAERNKIDMLPYLRNGLTNIAFAFASMAIGFTLIAIGNDSIGSILSNTVKVMIGDTYTENSQWGFYIVASFFLTKSMSQYLSQSPTHAENATVASLFAGLMMFLIWTTASLWGLLMYSIAVFGCFCVMLEWFIQNRAVALSFMSWKVLPLIFYVFWWIVPLIISIMTSPTIGWWSEIARMWVLNGIFVGILVTYAFLYVPAFRNRRQRWPGLAGRVAMYPAYRVENREIILEYEKNTADSMEPRVAEASYEREVY